MKGSGLPLLVLSGVERQFEGGRVHALRGVDLSVNPGERVAILGRSGSGKSTLLHIAAGLDAPDRGEVVFGGERQATPADWVRRRAKQIGIVFQSFGLLRRLTARENVEMAMPGVPGPERRRRAFAALDELDLAAQADQPQELLSGGERQRVALARALVNRPDLLLADEPTGNLDARSGDLVLAAILRQAGATGTAVILVTHDERLALRCERRVVLVDGRVAADDEVVHSKETGVEPR